MRADFDHVAELMRNGDRAGLLEFTKSTRAARAKAAAKRANREATKR